MTEQQIQELDKWYDGMRAASPVIVEADRRFAIVNDVCASLEVAGIEIRYDE